MRLDEAVRIELRLLLEHSREYCREENGGNEQLWIIV